MLTRFFRPKFKSRDFIWKAKQNFQSKNKSQSSAVQAVTSPQILDLWHHNTVHSPRIRFFYFNHWKVWSFALPAYYNVTRGSTSWLSIMKKNFMNLLRLNFNVVLYFYDFFLGGFPPNTSQKMIVALRYSHATVFHKNSLI